MALKENYIDDILDTSKNTKRKYNMITNADGTVSFEDVTEYSQNGDSFGSADINAITKKANKSLTGDDVVDNLESTETKLPLSANMGKKLNTDINDMKIMSDGESKQVSSFRDRPVYEISWKATLEDKTEGYKVITDMFNCNTIELIEVCGSVKHTSGSSAPIGHRVSDNYYSYIYLASDSLRLYHSADMASYMLTIRYQRI